MALPTSIPTRQHDCGYRPDVERWPILSKPNNFQGPSSALQAPDIKSVSGRNLHGASEGQSASILERVASQEIVTPTLDRLAHVIAKYGVEVAWERMGDVAASYNVSHRGREGVFKIHEIYRPHDYKTLADLMMVVADTEVQLRVLCASEIGCALLQQLFSIEDLRGQPVSTISTASIKEIITGSHEASDSPYLVHLSTDLFYISWKTVGWWEVYALDSLDILLREALDALPCTIMQPKPHPAWIKKCRPTIRRPASSWDCTLPPPKQSNAKLAKRPRDKSPLPSAVVEAHSTRRLAGEAHCKIALASLSVTERACEQALMAQNDGLAAFMCHATEQLPPVTSCSLRAKETKWRKLWRKLMCM